MLSNIMLKTYLLVVSLKPREGKNFEEDFYSD